jgi:CRP-like cAMP-binding protein
MDCKNISLERAIQLLSLIKDFKEFSSVDLEAVAKVCHWQHYHKEEAIVRYHDESNSAFLIAQGAVRVNYFSLAGKEVILCDLTAGEIFGELTAIDGLPRSATVVAKEDSLLASISSSAFIELIYTNCNFASTVLQRLTSQIRRLTERVFEVETLKVPNRIRAKLLHLAQTQAVIVNNEAIISRAPTHVELACLIGTHREAVTRELNKLKEKKIICCQGHEIRILNIDRLAEMVDEYAS